jgi:hypothetical protein
MSPTDRAAMSMYRTADACTCRGVDGAKMDPNCRSKRQKTPSAVPGTPRAASGRNIRASTLSTPPCQGLILAEIQAGSLAAVSRRRRDLAQRRKRRGGCTLRNAGVDRGYSVGGDAAVAKVNERKSGLMDIRSSRRTSPSRRGTSVPICRACGTPPPFSSQPHARAERR